MFSKYFIFNLITSTRLGRWIFPKAFVICRVDELLRNYCRVEYFERVLTLCRNDGMVFKYSLDLPPADSELSKLFLAIRRWNHRSIYSHNFYFYFGGGDDVRYSLNDSEWVELISCRPLRFYRLVHKVRRIGYSIELFFIWLAMVGSFSLACSILITILVPKNTQPIRRVCDWKPYPETFDLVKYEPMSKEYDSIFHKEKDASFSIQEVKFLWVKYLEKVSEVSEVPISLTGIRFEAKGKQDVVILETKVSPDFSKFQDSSDARLSLLNRVSLLSALLWIHSRAIKLDDKHSEAWVEAKFSYNLDDKDYSFVKEKIAYYVGVVHELEKEDQVRKVKAVTGLTGL